MTAPALYAGSAAVGFGVVVQLVFGWGSMAALVLLGISVICFMLIGKGPIFFLCAVAAALAAVGVVRTDLFEQSQRAHSVMQFVGGVHTLRGVVVADPDVRATSVRVTISLTQVDGANASGVAIAVLPRTADISYNDTVVAKGDVEFAETFTTNQGREFDYPHYLQAQGVDVLVQKATVVSRHAAGFSVVGFLFAGKHAFELSVEKVLPEPHAALLEGILLGDKRGLPKSLSNAFITSGLVHVVVLSGHNISVVSEGMFRALQFLPRAINLPLGALGIMLFAIMSGSGAATVRACIMGVVAIVARYFHRQAVAMRTLCLAAAAMALWNPFAALYDPGFVLSFLATFGLITLSPLIEKKLPAWLLRFPSIASIAASTLSVQLFVLPALLYYTGLVSIYALPANVLALPVIPAIMLSGFVAGLLGFVHPLLAVLPALVSQMLLAWMMWVAQTAAVLPGSTAAVDAFPAWWVVAVYVPLTWWAISVYRRSASRLHSS
jgi:competence protein ComEC